MATAEFSNDSDVRQHELVFVYGTLKRGQPNHHQLKDGRFCGEAQLAGLALYDLGPFPMAVLSREPAATLAGELYALRSDHLERLDRFEGAPRLYERQQHRLHDGRAVWVYVGRPRQVRHVPLIPSGRWRGRRCATAVLLLAGSLVLGTAASGGDLRRDCRALASSEGRERIAITNRIGRDQLLTKNHPFAEEQPDTVNSLYRWSDIQRVCRTVQAAGNRLAVQFRPPPASALPPPG